MFIYVLNKFWKEMMIIVSKNQINFCELFIKKFEEKK